MAQSKDQMLAEAEAYDAKAEEAISEGDEILAEMYARKATAARTMAAYTPDD